DLPITKGGLLMKKLVSVLIGLVIIGIAATTVSAADYDYEVQKGDSLWKIATENNTTVETLMEINELKSSLIHPKQVLKLSEEEAEHYVVQAGDTLTHISNAYDDEVTVEKLKEWNDLSSDLIITGEKLIVNEVGTEPTEINEMEQLDDEPESETGADASEEIIEEVESAKKTEETTANEIKGKTFAVEATAYTAGCSGCSGIT